MERRISVTYQNDLSTLRGQVSPDAHTRLRQLALDIQAAHEGHDGSAEHLDALVHKYIALREDAIADGLP